MFALPCPAGVISSNRLLVPALVLTLSAHQAVTKKCVHCVEDALGTFGLIRWAGALPPLSREAADENPGTAADADCAAGPNRMCVFSRMRCSVFVTTSVVSFLTTEANSPASTTV